MGVWVGMRGKCAKLDLVEREEGGKGRRRRSESESERERAGTLW